MLTLTDLKKKIYDEKILLNHTLKDIAKAVGISNSSLTNFINFIDDGTYKESNFDTVLKLTLRYFSKKEDIIEIMKSYSIRVNRPANLKMLLEYSDELQAYNFMYDLIRYCENNKNQTLKSIAAVYELIYKRNTKSVRIEELRDQVSILKNNDKNEATYLLLILESYIFYDLRDYQLLKHNLEILDKVLPQDNDDYLSKSYNLRKNELKMRYLLSNNKLKECREVANHIKNTSDNIRLIAHSLYTIGLSYIFESYIQCMDYFKRARELYSMIGHESSVKVIDLNSSLCKCIHNIKIDETVEIISELDKIYLYIKQNKDEKAQILLSKYVENNSITDNELPFLLFLKGTLEKNKDVLWQSYVHYLQKGDLFFINFPIRELQKMGVDNLNLFKKGD